MKILLAPDKFKGSINSFDVCASLAKGLKENDSSFHTLSFPMADGGDGFARVLAYYLGATERKCATTDPLGRPIQASYFLSENGVALIELAAASGLALLKTEEYDIMAASTLGTGTLIRDAIGQGVRKIVLGVGGSATNDGGMGILHALGVRFIGDDGKELLPCGGSLEKIRKIEPRGLPSTVKFQLAVDVENPLTGTRGAAHVYGPQKGADQSQVEALDKGLSNFASVLKRVTGYDVLAKPGMGAAGGVPAGLTVLLDAVISNGAELVIAASGFMDALPGADLVITGEGKIDDQSADGKLTGRIAAIAKLHGVHCIAVCGKNDWEKNSAFDEVIVMTDYASPEDAMTHPGQVLEKIGKAIPAIFSKWKG